ncbi:MAG: DJ-1/PfpI family protein [Candidatus Nanoarchaeia archaeon]
MNALIIVANKNFRDEELFITKSELENYKIKTIVASSEMTECTGMLKKTIMPDMLVSDARVENYDSIIFIGGMGISQYFNDSAILSLAKQFYAQGKVVAAICIAPVILANSGILKGKKATVSRSMVGDIVKEGAEYVGQSCVVDGKIITANGPSASKEFAKKIAILLLK